MSKEEKSFQEYLDSLEPEVREKTIKDLARHDAIFNKINEEREAGLTNLTYNREPYNPSTEYYFIDWFDEGEVRWIRTPLCTLQDVQELVSNMTPSGVRNLRIQSETRLSELHENVKDDGVNVEHEERVTNSEITERTFCFGGFYDISHEGRTGVPSLSKGSTESRKDWLKRVEEAQKEEDNS